MVGNAGFGGAVCTDDEHFGGCNSSPADVDVAVNVEETVDTAVGDFAGATGFGGGSPFGGGGMSMPILGDLGGGVAGVAVIGLLEGWLEDWLGGGTDVSLVAEPNELMGTADTIVISGLKRDKNHHINRTPWDSKYTISTLI